MKLRKNIPPIPSTLSLELEINPFLRTNNLESARNIAMLGKQENEVFGKIRELKDSFKEN